MPEEPFEYLKHIRNECAFIDSALHDVRDKRDFLDNETLKRAVVRSLEIIGEASKKIPADFNVSQVSPVPAFLRCIIGFRLKLI